MQASLDPRSNVIRHLRADPSLDGVIGCFGAFQNITHLVRILPPLLQNHLFPLEKRRLRGDSGDSLDDSPGAKAAHKTTQHLQAWTCMDRQESQSNWPNMRKTLGKPGFLSGEDRNRTFGGFPSVFVEFERCLKMDCCKWWGFLYQTQFRVELDRRMAE